MASFYSLLKEKYPNKADVVTEMINLEAINHLPKGTEHFVSDLHGEFAAFDYILRTGSGAIKRKVKDCLEFYQLKEVDLEEICLYIYYPEEKIAVESVKYSLRDWDKRLSDMILVMIRIASFVGSKYTHSKLRKSLPKSFAYIIEELMREIDKSKDKDKAGYLAAIITKLGTLRQLESFFIALCHLVQGLVIDHLHVLGDIFDRGPYPDKIFDRLEKIPSLDIQWGNHDITWMGAVSGSYICMVNVIRIAARYNNLSLLEDRYGINLRPLIEYSRKYYEPLPNFSPIIDEGFCLPEETAIQNSVQQATAILQFKLENQLIDRRPEFLMDERKLLSKIDFESNTIVLGEHTHSLNQFNSCRISPQEPSSLDAEERILLDHLMKSFQSSERLGRQVEFLYKKGGMYLCYNNNLLLHGCIPLHQNGDFKSLRIQGRTYKGKSLLDFYEQELRSAYQKPHVHDDLATDLIWYLWAGETSSLFGKHAMTTFERYYVEDKVTHKEVKNPYFQLREKETICLEILKAFGLPADGHIINGHTPVIEKAGENPIKANAKLVVIDGGFAKGYQKKTGMAGYTLVYNSFGLQLVAHKPFTNIQDVLDGKQEIISTKRLVEEASQRILVKKTTVGQGITQEIRHLEHLFKHYEKY